MDHFLDQDYIVSYMPSFNEATLVLWNDYWEYTRESVGDYFCDNLVANIAQGNQAESVKG